ncbi:hypothetical protein [Ornithinimicrobium pratense]|uniref:Uncharacterized protein n=1 Tax=Ornithinimicrobium pratense TaxID=2593973 RepID=A0A5J6V2C6_9MICO|nr:hypothetical protein [Ornithinimicrobium pratense]QFG67858.1 hypothetical protein FY030_03170 [Ornithinimicrobium pratense]
MNSIAKRPTEGDPRAVTETHSRTTDHLRLAPSVEPAWVEDFVLEQRLLGVPGDRIGDALALVQSHVAESGESVHEAFGDPVAYAREAASTRRVDDDRDLSWILGSGLGLAGMLLTLFGVQAWIDGDGRLALTVGHLVALGLVVVAFALLHLASEPFLRFVLRRPWSTLGLFVLHFAAMVAAFVFLRTPVAHVPAGATVAVGVTTLALGTLLEWRSRTAGQLEDPILGPGEGRPARRRLDWFGGLTLLMFPVLTVAMVGFSLLVARLS